MILNTTIAMPVLGSTEYNCNLQNETNPCATGVTTETVTMDTDNSTSDPSPSRWQINFFSIFIEHPAMRNPQSAYLTFRMITLVILLPAGLLGNTMTIAVMRRPRMRKQSVSFTLSVLAFCDGCCIVIRGLLWINIVFAKMGRAIPVRFESDAACRTVEYLFSSIHISGSWIVVYITLERMVAILIPMKSSLICRPSTAKVVLPLCLFGPFCVFSYLPAVCRYLPGVGCVTRVKPDMLIHFVMATTCVSMLPLTIIAISNVGIVIQLSCQAARAPGKQLTAAESRRAETFRRVTNMVLSVSFAFLATVFPQAANAMMRILNPQWRWLDVTDDVCAILWDVNYAINFYLYVITGRSVRAELKQMLGCRVEGEKVRGVASQQQTVSVSTE